MGYSEEVKYEIIKLYYSNDNNVSRVRNEYHRIYPRRTVPSVNTVKNMVKRFGETKSVKRKNRTVSRNADDDLNILLYLEESPEVSMRDAVNYLNTSLNKIYRTLRLNNYHPYKFLPVQGLSEDNKQRLDYCQKIWQHILEYGDFLNKIVFSDEESFTTAGMFNRHNKHFWAKENPQKILLEMK